MLLILRSKKKSSKKINSFNKKISRHLKRVGIIFSFASFEDIEAFIETSKVNIVIKKSPLKNWTTIYSRKVGRYKTMAFIIAILSKKCGIKFIDNFYEKNEDFSDASKIKQTFNFAINNLPIPKTYFSPAYSNGKLSQAINFLGLPMIIKICNTSQGGGVFLAKNKQDLEIKIKKISKDNPNEDIFLQEFIPNDFEYRIFVTGKSVGAIEKKIRTDANEFRNNIHLGAREEFLKKSDIKKAILNIAIKAARVSRIQVCGVDIIKSPDGRLALFEANSCPGITLDEKVSPELKNLALYLKKCEKK